MRGAVRHHELTLASYFDAERASTRKHEYADGQIWLMAGGSARHNYLETRLLDAIARRLQGGPCFTMTSNQRIATEDGLYTYADGSVFCGGVTVGAGDTATDPVVLVEVLSDSTRAYDRGEKLERYKTVASLQHVVLVEQDAVDVEVWTRTPDGWVRAVRVEGGDRVRLSAIGVEIPVSEIYDGVDRVPSG